MTQPVNQSRRWCFTINNYGDADEVTVGALKAKYLIFGREISTTGTPHLQGFVIFKAMMRLARLKKLIPRAHWEIAKSTSLACSEYCKKEGNYFEEGTLSQQGRRTDLEACKDIIDKGGSLHEVADQCFGCYLKYTKGLKEYQLLVQPKYEHDDVRGLWIFGEPGSGKSRYVRDNYDEIYWKPQNKWFDGYSGEDVILIDDLDKGGTFLSHYLKIWGDRYACTGETKGGTVNLTHKKIIITSNYHPSDLWPDDDKLLEAILRRYEVMEI